MGLVDKLKSKFNNLDFMIVTASTIICSAISFAYSVLAKRYVGLLDYGIYSTCLLLQTYLTYAQCGVMNAYNRDMPQLMGAGKTEEAQKLKNTTITFVWAMYALVAVIAAVVLTALRAFGRLDTQYYVGYMLVLLCLVLDNTGSFSLNTSKIYGHFNFSAVNNLVKTLIAFPIGVIGAKFWGYYGLFLMPLSSALLMIILYYQDGIRGVRLRIERTVLKNSIVTGIPLMIDNLIWTVMGSVDKFVILIFMTTEDLGAYTVPLLGFSTMVLVPQTISGVFYIKISNEYGAHHDIKQMMDLCNKYTRINSLCTSAVAVVSYYALPILVSYVMPMYTEATFPAQILLIGVAIYGSAMLYGNIFSVMKWNFDLILNSVILTICNAIFSTGMVLILGRQIENVALGTSISYCVYSLMMLIKLSGRTGVNVLDFLASSWLPLIAVIAPAIVLYYVIPNLYISFAIVCVLLLTEAFVAIRKITIL